MSFYDALNAKYAPYLTVREFSDMMNVLETELFSEHPEYLELPEDAQNVYVESYLRSKNVRH